MARPDIDVDSLPGEWLPVKIHEAAALVDELSRELGAGHALHGVVAEPVAIKRLRKDTVWWVPERQCWALVHLTYKVESDPRWPACDFFADWASLLHNWDD